VLKEVVAFAKERGIIVLSDDIYRPLFHSLPEGQETPPSILSFGYDKVISTSSTSKCFSLPGIRVGWIATRDKAIQHAVSHAREYTTISVSQLDDQVATHTFSPTVLPNLIARNTALAKTNLALLEAFIEVKNGKGELVDDLAFCLDVLEKNKVLLVLGSLAFGRGVDFKGFVRIGYAVRTELLQEALEKLGPYIEKYL
jgi:aspartate/methionine/tyrosine aminotransferase